MPGLPCSKRLEVFPRRLHMATTEDRPLNEDEKLLAKLGYAQDLNRSWSGFSNFAISFSIISILAGCFTNFGAGWNNGGPISISWSWPILGLFILIIGFTMSELVSAYPTSGGIYWWASKLGGPAAGFFTGWLNLIGLIAVTAGVSYGCATFIDLTLSTYSDVVRRRLLADAGLPHLRGRAGPGLGAQHLQQPPDGGHEQRLGVVARRRCGRDRADPDPRPRPAPVLQLRVHRAVQQLRLRRRQHHQLRVLVRDRAVRLPADAVHDHRLRRLRAPVRGDRRGLQGSGQGHLASIVYSVLGGYILLLCVVFASRTAPTATRTTPVSAAAASPSSSSRPWAPTGRRWCCSSPRRRSSSAPPRA